EDVDELAVLDRDVLRRRRAENARVWVVLQRRAHDRDAASVDARAERLGDELRGLDLVVGAGDDEGLLEREGLRRVDDRAQRVPGGLPSQEPISENSVCHDVYLPFTSRRRLTWLTLAIAL